MIYDWIVYFFCKKANSDLIENDNKESTTIYDGIFKLYNLALILKHVRENYRLRKKWYNKLNKKGLQDLSFTKLLHKNILLDRLHIVSKMGITGIQLNADGFDQYIEEVIIESLKNNPVFEEKGLDKPDMITGDYSYNIAVIPLLKLFSTYQNMKI